MMSAKDLATALYRSVVDAKSHGTDFSAATPEIDLLAFVLPR
jgi:hypothetical protein